MKTENSAKEIHQREQALNQGKPAGKCMDSMEKHETGVDKINSEKIRYDHADSIYE
ncbi:hypothetical protein [Paenibacillus sp. J2TS4]|uniref:hypothetical protein n=1 Tax=Paenibacillus sp. J2TS4 TaxID=2807194 RepID=UPI001B295111|nr:hypothetical protein [Paenibacillus sp. J2TS4]GIP34799.1 hypothetical protein J2TS4_40090 [Paenibacillus sp. J2TS4]